MINLKCAVINGKLCTGKLAEAPTSRIRTTKNSQKGSEQNITGNNMKSKTNKSTGSGV